MRFPHFNGRRVLIGVVIAALAVVASVAFAPDLLSTPALAQQPAISTPAAAPLTAAEATLKKTLETRLGAPVDGLTKVPALGLYEVRVGEDVLYTDANGDYLVVGNLIDLRSRENLTRKRVAEIREASLPVFKFAELPLDDAVKVVKGNGKRKIAIFEDPNCGYCKKLEASLHSISDVTIYVFLYPVLGPDSLAKSKQVWCASNRSKAWSEWMEKGTALSGEGACATPLDKTLALGKKLKVDGTPTLFFSNNKRAEGAIDQAELEKALAAS
jgi:thiol:disulfide interchange protein DsbC